MFDSIQPPLTRDSPECADPAVHKRDFASDQKISDRTRDHDLVRTRVRGDPRADVNSDSDCIAADHSHLLVWMPALTCNPSFSTPGDVANAQLLAAAE